MNMTQDQIRKEFARQVYLCSGIGRTEMMAIVEKEFTGQHEWTRTITGEMCRKCGRNVSAAGKPCEKMQ